MSTIARELLKKQLIELTKDADNGFSVGLEDDSDFFRWRVCFEGPSDSLYEGGIFTAILAVSLLVRPGQLRSFRGILGCTTCHGTSRQNTPTMPLPLLPLLPNQPTKTNEHSFPRTSPTSHRR